MNLKILNNIFEINDLDVIFSSSYQTRFWYTQIETTAGYLFIEKNFNSTLLIDSRYIENAKKNAKNVNVLLLTKKILNNFIEIKNYKKIGIEKDYLTLNEFDFIQKIFPNAQFIKISGQKLRMIKSDKEIDILKKGLQIHLKTLKKIKKYLIVGKTEIQIAKKIEYFFKQLKASNISFDTIVASGPNCSKPHAKPTNRKFQEGDLVIIDSGLIYKGFSTDLTRTFQIGKSISFKLQEIWNIVKQAQELTINAIKPGIFTNQIDKICRDFIKKNGYDKYFVHATGHGIGIEVHEMPNISSNSSSNIELKENMIITIEPGIYIEKLGGVRIEDNILVTSNGFEILSKQK